MDKYSDSVKFTVVEKKAEPTPTPTVPEEPTVPGGSTTNTVKFVALETNTFSIEEGYCELKATETLDFMKYQVHTSDYSKEKVDIVIENGVAYVNFVAPGKVTIQLSTIDGRLLDQIEIEITASEEELPPEEEVPTEPEVKPVVALTAKNDGVADAVTITTNEDGTVKVDCVGHYKGVTYAVPETATKVNEVTTVILNITASAQFGLQAYDTTGAKFVDNYPGYDLKEVTTADYYVTVDPSKNILSSLLVQCLDKADTTTFTINSITFVAESSETINDFELNVDEKEASVVSVTKNQDGSSTIECTGQYKGASYTIPTNVIGDGKIVSVAVDVNIDNQICIQAYDSSWKMLTQDYPGYGVTESTDKTFTLAIHPTAEAGIGALRIQSQKAEQNITVKSITVNKALWVEKNW